MVLELAEQWSLTYVLKCLFYSLFHKLAFLLCDFSMITIMMAALNHFIFSGNNCIFKYGYVISGLSNFITVMFSFIYDPEVHKESLVTAVFFANLSLGYFSLCFSQNNFFLKSLTSMPLRLRYHITGYFYCCKFLRI